MPGRGLRVALATHAFSWENAGGGEVMVRLLAGHLAALGHEVHVLTADARGDARDAAFRVRVLPSTTVTALRAALKDVRPDVVDAHNMECSVAATLAARSLRIPVVVTANSAWATCLFADMYRPGHGICETCTVAGVADGFRRRPPEQIGRRVPALVGYAEVRRRRALLSLADRIVVHSEAARGLLLRNGFPEAKLRVVPNFDEPRMRTPHAPEGERVLFVGGLTIPKNADGALDAFALLAPRHPRATLHYAGRGHLEPALRERARMLGVADRVTFHGYVPHDRVQDLYRSAAVVLFPSRGEEAFGRVTLEAWNAGAPLVATRVSAPGEVVRHGETGLLADPERPKDMAEAIERILDDPALGARLAEAGRKELERYHPDAVVPRFVDVYREAMGA